MASLHATQATDMTLIGAQLENFFDASDIVLVTGNSGGATYESASLDMEVLLLGAGFGNYQTSAPFIPLEGTLTNIRVDSPAGASAYDIDIGSGIPVFSLAVFDDEDYYALFHEPNFLQGSAFDDHLFGDQENDQLSGGGGNDILEGGGDNDVLIGDPGNDQLSGGDDNDQLFGLEGNDIIEGGHGADLLIGGDGVDTLSYAGSGDAVNIVLGTGGEIISASGGDADGDTGGQFENITGSDFNDILQGNSAANALTGGAGNDVLIGGLGKDFLTGGADADTFDFDSKKDSKAHKKAKKADVITDFSQSDGDVIDLFDIDAKKGGGNQKFKWIGKKDFHEKKGELHYFKQKGVLVVEGDIKGNGKADFQIKVDGPDLNKLFADDFIL